MAADATAPGAITVRYASTRTEVWRTCWRAWARGLWRVHLGIGVVGGALLAVTALPRGVPLVVGNCLAVFAACLLSFPLVPQLEFKSAERELTIDPAGTLQSAR